MERQRYGISQDWLKVIAMVSMAVDHTGVVLFPGALGWRLIGRMAFPIYLWLLVSGFLHTKDVRKYFLRLGAFALLSEIPFDLATSGVWMTWRWQNVFFTLALCLLLLCAAAYLEKKSALWTAAAVLLAMALSELLRFDYGCMGPLLAFLLFRYRQKKSPALPVCFLLFCLSDLLSPLFSGSFPLTWRIFVAQAGAVQIELFGIVAVPLIGLDNGVRRWRRGRYFFYLFYPLHLLALVGIARLF